MMHTCVAIGRPVNVHPGLLAVRAVDRRQRPAGAAPVTVVVPVMVVVVVTVPVAVVVVVVVIDGLRLATGRRRRGLAPVPRRRRRHRRQRRNVIVTVRSRRGGGRGARRFCHVQGQVFGLFKRQRQQHILFRPMQSSHLVTMVHADQDAEEAQVDHGVGWTSGRQTIGGGGARQGAEMTPRR